MADFSGLLQTERVMDRLRSELNRSILEAARPRVFDDNHLPTGGGYGLTIPLDKAPQTWKDDTHDELCPVLEHWQWTNIETGGNIEALGIDPFSPAELTDGPTGGVVTFGAGLMLVELEDIGPAAAPEGLGRNAPIGADVDVRIEIRVPARRGLGQMNLYSGLLARVLGDQIIQTADGLPADALQFGWVPETARVVGVDGGWLVGAYSAAATRIYFRPFIRAA